MPGPGRRTRRAATPAAFAIFLASWAPIVLAQGGAGVLVSPVARVQLVAVVLPRVTPAARSGGIVWSGEMGTGVAELALAANTPFRIIAHRVERGPGAPTPRSWVEVNGSEREVTAARSVVVRRGRSGDGLVRVPFRIRTEGGGSGWASGPLLRFDVVVDPAP
jgi:hypothetical protein